MKFFIDTANLNEIKAAQSLGVLDGVTTNPSLMAKEGITGKNNILKHYVDICNICDGEVSAEVNAVDYDGMIKEGEELAELHDQIVVKLPMTKEGVMAVSYTHLDVYKRQDNNPIATSWFGRRILDSKPLPPFGGLFLRMMAIRVLKNRWFAGVVGRSGGCKKSRKRCVGLGNMVG